ARRQAEVRVKRMIEDVDERFKAWKQQQPMCWEMYRQMSERSSRVPQATSGYGSGHGRLGGAHASSSPRVSAGSAVISGGSGGQGFGVMGLAADSALESLSSADTAAAARGPGPKKASSSVGPATKAASASGTNNQIVGVDE